MNFKSFNFWEFLGSLRFVKNLLNWAKKTSFPGFERIPIYDIVRFILKEAQTDDISTRANSMAFSFFLALFPASIFLFTLMPLFRFTEDYVEAFRLSISGVLPKNAEDYIFEIIYDVTSNPNGGLFTLGFVLALFFSSQGISSMMKGFSKSYESTFREVNYFQRQWTAIKITILTSALLVTSIITIVLGQFVLNYIFDKLNISFSTQILIQIGRWTFLVILFHAVISSIYRFGAPTIEKFKYFSPGATAATLFMIILSLGFAYFVNNFGTYNKIYGSIGALIVILIWIQFNCTILLVGYEINASIAVNKNLLKKEKLDE